jgi:hypothetical protein
MVDRASDDAAGLAFPEKAQVTDLGQSSCKTYVASTSESRFPMGMELALTPGRRFTMSTSGPVFYDRHVESEWLYFEVTGFLELTDSRAVRLMRRLTRHPMGMNSLQARER